MLPFTDLQLVHCEGEPLAASNAWRSATKQSTLKIDGLWIAASLRDSQWKVIFCLCERREAIHGKVLTGLDCRVPAGLAMN
jgi:hypothetical protein